MRVGDFGCKHAVVLLALGTVGFGAAGCGTASDITDKDAGWFSKPMHLFETPSFMGPATAGKTEARRAVTPEDLVDASGYCAGLASASVAPGPGGAVAPDAPAGPSVAGGIALGMTECEVVQRAGRAEKVDIGAEGGARSVVLTYSQGERAGIYRFAGGRLQIMDRVAEAAKPAKSAKPVKKKPAKKPVNPA
ncbi:MAG: hypothetical protein JWN71_1638 [Xanthobacteraceae bacterium]|nr:hypothetical protein [Xanthobacteraceae bacterium]